MKEVAVCSGFPVCFLLSLSVSYVYISKGEERYSFSASTCDPRLLGKARPHTCCALWIQTAAGQICGMDYVCMCVLVCVCVCVCVFVFAHVLLNLQASAEKMSECFLGACIRGV